MSNSIVLWPIIKALCMASQFVNIDSVLWSAINQNQQLFLDNHFINRYEASAFTDKELRGWASTDYQELNDILQRERFDIRLEPFQPGSVGVVSVLDVQVELLQEGNKTKIVGKCNETEGNEELILYPAIEIENDFQVFEVVNYKQPIVCIETKSHDKVWMTVADHNIPLKEFELLQWIKSIKNDSVCSKQCYGSVTFPMIDLNQVVDISWLLQMKLPDENSRGYWIVAQALQQTKFKMNEFGARVKSVAAIEVQFTCACPSQNIMIDKPFYIWIERPGVTDPIFAGYMTQQDWKNPVNLDL